MTAPYLVIVTGSPGAGKTAIGLRLAAGLGLPFFTKDGFKELLFDSLGKDESPRSALLSGASFDLLHVVAEREVCAGRSCVLEANFYPEEATQRFTELQRRYPFSAVQIVCRAPDAVLLQRFRERARGGERHPAHTRREGEPDPEDRVGGDIFTPLDIGGAVIEVDTSDFEAVDHADLLGRVRAFLQ